MKVSMHMLYIISRLIHSLFFTQPMHTCCLLCHREFKDWGASSPNGLPGGHGTKLADAVPALSQALLRETPGRKLADAVPSLSQSLLGEVPLWICQSCCKSVEEEERRSTQEQPNSVDKHALIYIKCLSSHLFLTEHCFTHNTLKIAKRSLFDITVFTIDSSLVSCCHLCISKLQV